MLKTKKTKRYTKSPVSKIPAKKSKPQPRMGMSMTHKQVKYTPSEIRERDKTMPSSDWEPEIRKPGSKIGATSQAERKGDLATPVWGA